MNDEPRQITVAVLDDVRWDRENIARDLAPDPNIRVIGATADPGQFFLLVCDAKPDVAIIDLKIKDDERAGLKALGELNAARLPTHYFVLTSYPKLAHFVTALDRGADAFVDKDLPEDQRPSLPAIVRILVAGGQYYDGRMVRELRRHISVPTDRLLELAASRPPTLTPAERAVLADAADGQSYQDIARTRNTSENTVKAQLATIRDKFGVKKTREAVELARFLEVLDD